MMGRSVSRNIAAAVASLLLMTVPNLAQQGATNPNLTALVESERAFAQDSVEKGVRASFLDYFAPNCVSFDPEPGNARFRLLSRPAPATLPPVVLNWRPIYADITQAGDIGYTTGPYTFVNRRTDPSSTSYGYYFSVWKKQKDGAWKVVLDIGIGTPDASAAARAEFHPAPAIQLKLKKNYNPADGWLEVVELEKEFARLASTKGSKSAYLKFGATDLRLHRDGHFPLVGAEVENSVWWNPESFAASAPTFIEVAESGDLGYVYGRYQVKNGAGAVTETGYYARVWRRDAKANWKLAADITSPSPAGK